MRTGLLRNRLQIKKTADHSKRANGLLKLPGLDTRRTTSGLFLIAITPFFEIYYEKVQAYRCGEKPEKFTNFGRLTKRLVLQLDRGIEPKNVILEARRYQTCLETIPGRTRAEVVEIFGISRARFTQYLNLLKLPSVIVGFLETSEDPAILHYFTERRLRPLTRLANVQEKWEQFEAILKKC